MNRLVLYTTILAVSAPASAGLINYGDFAGDTVTFTSVTESSLDPGVFYGSPTVVGDALDFTTSAAFAVQVENGGIDFLDVRMTFTVTANEGELIDSITFREFGAYFNSGADSDATVSAIGFVQSDGGIVGEEFTFTQDGDGSGRWLETLTMNFAPTSEISFTLDNMLFAFADDPGVAFIDKKGLRITAHTIPAPSAIALLAVGGLVGSRRRRS